MTFNLQLRGDWDITMKFSSLAAPEVVKMTTFGAASDENFVKMTFLFLWIYLEFRIV